MSIESIITAIAAIQKTITGVKRAHDNSPESLSELPAFVNYPAYGDIGRAAGLRMTTHLVKMQLYVTKRVDLAREEAKVRPFIALVLNKFDANLRLTETASVSGITHYDYGVLSYGGTPYLGISFDLEVIENEPTTFQ